MDFTQNKLKKLYKNMLIFYDDFLTFEEYLRYSKVKEDSKFLILRHDVDKNPYNSLKFALIQNCYLVDLRIDSFLRKDQHFFC